MASAIGIANMALGYVADETISSFSDDNKRARLCTLYFSEARRRALRLGTWNCASKRADLPKDGTAPLWGYDNRYRLPHDFIRLIAIQDAGEEYRHSIEDDYILCDLAAPLHIKYVFDDNDVSAFDPLLTQVTAIALALDLVMPLARSNTKKQELKDDMKSALALAKSSDGQERPPQNYRSTSWVRARARGG